MSARLERARILVETHRFADAEREAGMALAEEPDSAPAHALLAICLLQREDYAGATEHAEQAVGLAPNEPSMHFMLSGVWMARNYLDKAEAEIRIAIELDPFDAD
ncbi:MAG: tetratricopeptide repeat protein, partial [Pirellulales bacterium]|nr:tetratricopeptide repeat protein [Pirellulales bacterium]